MCGVIIICVWGYPPYPTRLTLGGEVPPVNKYKYMNLAEFVLGIGGNAQKLGLSVGGSIYSLAASAEVSVPAADIKSDRKYRQLRYFCRYGNVEIKVPEDFDPNKKVYLNVGVLKQDTRLEIETDTGKTNKLSLKRGRLSLQISNFQESQNLASTQAALLEYCVAELNA